MPRPKTAYPKRRALPRGELPPGVVKSAARVLQLLEFFDDIKRPATVVEITETLKYPQSSTCALLQTLVTMGYLTYNIRGHHYIPSDRVGLLGHWVNPNLINNGALLRMIGEIGARTGESVMLATRRNFFAQYIHVLQPPGQDRLHLTLGALLPLAASTTGYAILSTYPDAEIRKIVLRINAEAPPDADRVNLVELIEIIKQIRDQGYCFKIGVTTPGRATISIPLPIAPGQAPLAISIAGEGEAMAEHRDFLVSVLRQEIQSYLANWRQPRERSA